MNPPLFAASAVPFASSTDEATLPVAGICFLLALIVIAVLVIALARWRVGGGKPTPWFFRGAANSANGGGDVVRQVSVLRLDGMARLHVVVWGNRQMLIATAANAAPVLLATEQATGSADSSPSAEPMVTSHA